MTTTATIPTATFASALRRLYVTRFAFAVVWAGLVFTTATATSPQLTVLLIAYPLFDAAAVLWQIRANPDPKRGAAAERTNVVVSVIVAIALGVASTQSLGAALAVWGAWAIGAGIPQLIAAIRNRRSGGQVAQMLSGGLSVLAGSAFLVQGLKGSETVSGAAGYAILGGVFFLISALRLNATLRRAAV
jgi:uncharacterized membrane protein HdeD (DUF308 family)